MGDGNHFAATDVARGFTVGYNFDAWRAVNYTPTEIGQSISGPTSVYGQDGLSNLVKYALKLNAKTNATSGIPVLSTDGTNWIYTFTQDAAVTGVTITVEFSSNLTSWTTSGVTLSYVSTANGLDTYRATYPVSLAANAFFRVNVTQ